MAFQYPAKNSAGTWDHGQEVKMTVGGREVVVAKYDAKKNLWQHLQVNQEGVFTYAYACHILIDRSKCPKDPCLETLSWDNIEDVQDALDWIYLRLKELFEKVESLEKRVKQNEIDIDFLYATLSAIENLADVSEFLNRLDEIEERLENLDATDINQGTLETFAFSFAANNRTIPENVAVGTQQETNYYLADMVGQLAAANQQEHADIIRLIAELDEHTIWFGAAPPQEDTEKYKFWWDTNTLELLINYNNQWFPVSIPPEQIEIVATTLAELQRDTMLNEQRIAQLRRDIAAGDFRPGLQQVLAVNNTATSGAEFGGKVKVSPGSEGDEAVTYQQLVELEEEIESLAPSLDRGKWNLAELGPGVTLASGEYAMGIGANRVYCEEGYEQCLLAIGSNPNDDPAALAECNRIWGECFNAADGNGEYYMNDWSHATLLHFHKTDSEGKNHTFNDYKVGMFIDLFDQGDSGYAVFEITEAPTLDGDVYTIGVHPVQHEGEAAGLARVKVFELAGADPADYVRKTGDTMTGKLLVKPPKNNGGLWIYAPQGDAGEGQADTMQLLRVANSKNAYVFYVEESGAIAGKQGMVPTDPRHLTSKDYVDSAIASALANQFEPGPAQLSWVYRKPSSGKGPADGTFWKDSNHFRISMKTHNGVNLAHAYPPAKNEWWAPGGEKYGGRYVMTIWKKYSDGWTMYDTIECDKTRWVLTTDGITHFQFRRSWEAHDKSFSTGAIYYITVGGFF